MSEAPARPHGVLENVLVLDLTQMLAGPYCTQLLADQGAQVVKVEPPGGDIARSIGPFHPQDRERAFGGYFQSINRGKRSIVLDLKSSEGRAALLELADKADVLVENFRTGVMERLGLGYETLQERNPRLVYGAIRGFGDPRGGASPYANWPALDVVAQAMGGMMGITGPDTSTPLKVGPGIGDTIPALFLAFGLMCALLEARRSGRGQFVDVAMTDSILAVCERIVHQQSYVGVTARPEGNRHPLLCPFGLIPARDGWVTVACPADAFWRELCAALDLQELAADPRFATNQARLQSADEVYGAIATRSEKLTKAELIERLGGRVPFGPVYSSQDVFRDPHFRQRGMLLELEHPGVPVPITVAGSPVKLTRTPGVCSSRAPRLGEHQCDFVAGTSRKEL
jgi:crotonobetainyl-CoA:carnitine CoA-transferase CaiB-like acyl-CoA transferase